MDAQQEHFDVLRNADRYVASSIRESEQSIVEFCAQVHQSYLRDFRAMRRRDALDQGLELSNPEPSIATRSDRRRSSLVGAR